MADISDVLAGIGGLIGSTLYPNGATGENPSPVVNAPVLIQAGWPDSASLQNDLATGKVVVTLWPSPTERNTTRYPERRVENVIPATTWTLTNNGDGTVSVGGSPMIPYTAQNLCIIADGAAYVAQDQEGFTTAMMAQALMNAIAPGIPGVSQAANQVVFPPGTRIGDLRVMTFGSTTKEVGRQERQVSIIIWSGTPALRDAVAKAIDPVLRDVHKVLLPDDQMARLTYVRSLYVDAEAKEGIYRRDLVFSTEYGTTREETWPQVIATNVQLSQVQEGLVTPDFAATYPDWSSSFEVALNFDITTGTTTTN